MIFAKLALAVVIDFLVAAAFFPALALGRWKRAALLVFICIPLALSPLLVPAAEPLLGGHPDEFDVASSQEWLELMVDGRVCQYINQYGDPTRNGDAGGPAAFVARARGQHWRGVRLALLGNVATAAAGHLGGYLALERGTAGR